MYSLIALPVWSLGIASFLFGVFEWEMCPFSVPIGHFWLTPDDLFLSSVCFSQLRTAITDTSNQVSTDFCSLSLPLFHLLLSHVCHLSDFIALLSLSSYITNQWVWVAAWQQVALLLHSAGIKKMKAGRVFEQGGLRVFSVGRPSSRQRWRATNVPKHVAVHKCCACLTWARWTEEVSSREDNLSDSWLLK